MRRWLLLGAAVVVVGATAIAYALTRLDDYLTAHRGELALWASQAIGRPVAFADIGVSLRGGGSARVTDLRIADDPRFGGDFLSASSAVVSISLFDMAHGRLHIRSVVLDTPTLTLARDAIGWNIDSLGSLRAVDTPAGAGAPPASGPTAGRPPAADTPMFSIASIALRNGTMTVADRSRQPPTTLTVAQVDVTLKQAAPRDAIHVDGSAALFGSTDRNATLAGTITPGTPAAADLRAQWKPVPLAGLAPVVPVLTDFGVDGAVGGDLRFVGPLSDPNGQLASWLAGLTGAIDLRGLAVAIPAIATRVTDLSGTLRFTPSAIDLAETTARLGEAPVAVGCRLAPPAAGVAQCRLTAGSIDLRPLNFGDGTVHELTVEATLRPLDTNPLLRATVQVSDGQVRDATFRQLDAAVTLQGGTLEVERASLQAFGGNAQASGRCTGASGPAPECAAQLAVQGAQIATMLAGLRSAAAHRVDGQVDADLHVTTSGRDAAALRRSIRGTGSVRVTNGVVQGVNLAQRVLGAVPGVDKLLRSSGRAATLLGSGATRFDHLTATLHLADERVASNDVALSSEDFSVNATGSAGFAGDLSAHGVFRGSAPLVDDLADGVPWIGKLVAGTKGIVTIPFSVGGTLENPRVDPDLTSVPGGIGRDATAGLDALFGAPDPKRGRAGGVLRQELDKLFGH